MDNGHGKQKIIIQVVCVLLSIGLWFYVTNTENPIRTVEINRIPVEIINGDKLQESKLALAPSQDLYVSLKIEGSYKDVKNITKDDFKIKVDLSEYALKKGSYKVPVEVVDQPNKITIKNSGVSTITINIEEYKEKQVNVSSNIELEAQPDHYVLTPEFSPEVITVGGPESLVDKVQNVRAEGREVNVSENIERTCTLSAVDESDNVVNGVNLSDTTVKAIIKVNNGKTIPIKLNTVGSLKEGLKLGSIELDNKTVSIIGPKDIVDKIAEVSTSPLDLSQITESTNVNLTLVLQDGIQSNIANNTVVAKVQIEKPTTKKIDVEVTYEGVHDGIQLSDQTTKVSVTLSGLAEELEKVTANNVKAIMDISKSEKEESHTETPTVNLVGLGSSVKVESVGTVNYKITKQ